VLLAFLAALSSSLTDWLLGLLLWFLIWAPLVALLEYATHRWIMHWANRLLDPKLKQLRAHGTHHRGHNDHEFVDMPLKNCLLLTSPLFLLMSGWGLAVGPLGTILIPAAALLAWCFFYSYLWNQIHRAIHGIEFNWFRQLGPIFRFFRNHHLKHHAHAGMNYGTVFPWTDYMFLTYQGRKGERAGQRGVQPHDQISGFARDETLTEPR
jgi:hypothetical protein